ncbi:MAG TPA: hypothetical protein VMU02_00525, partial [bacterium]|nr:hypothetical protein [bacterium]
MAKIVRYFLTIACVMVASDSVLVISNWCRDFVGLMVCILLLLVCWRGLGTELPRRLIVFAGLSVLAGVAFSLNGLVVRLAAVGWVIGLLWLSEGHAITPAADGADASLAVVHLSAVGFAIALAAYGRSASVWFGLERVVRALSIRHLGLAAPATGAWISGLPVWLFGLIALGVAAALQGANWRCLICGLGLVAGAAATRAMCAISAVNGPAGIAASQIASVALVAFLLAVASAAGRGAVPERGRRHASRQILGISLALTIAALAVAGLPLSGGHRPPPDRPKSSFLIYPYGLLDWRVPDFERVGLVNAGMFGLFLRLLERDASTSGGEVTMATDRISPGDLLDVGIIVFINPVKELDDREIRAVERFVAAGGGLLVLGDHTNIGGSMRPLNSVLSFTR